MELIEEFFGSKDAIRKVVSDAFGQEAEVRLVDELRRDGCLAFSLLAYSTGEFCGYAALSLLKSPIKTLALAPVAVTPKMQGKGVGAALVRGAIERARMAGYAAIFVLGAPAYYGRFGFSAAAAEGFASPYAGPEFMALHLGEAPVAPAALVYPNAFDGLG
jgi:putative acetyltransferase